MRTTNDSIKLDEFDKRILWEFSHDLRMPRKPFAKKLGISPERLHYKIKRLTKELIDPSIILNYSLLGMSQFIILLGPIEEESLKKLVDQAPLFGLFQVIGKYQCLLYVVTRDISQFCSQFLAKEYFKIYPIIHAIPDFYNPFGFDRAPDVLKTDREITLDNKDYSILYHLAQNPLEPIAGLSQKTRSDPKTVNSRIKRMLDANIIQLFRYAINIFKFGMTAYFLKIKVTPQNKKKVLFTIRYNNYSGFVYETYHGFIMWYMPPSHNELFRFTKVLREIEKGIKIDVMQSANILLLKTVPDEVMEYLHEKSK